MTRTTIRKKHIKGGEVIVTSVRSAGRTRGFFTRSVWSEKKKGFQTDEIKNHDSESRYRIIQGVFGIYTNQRALRADKAENHQYHKSMRQSCIVCGVLEVVGNYPRRTSLEKIFEAGRRGAAAVGSLNFIMHQDTLYLR